MFQASHQHLSGEFTLPLAIDSAYPLFTPLGETLWVPDWQPQYFHPADGHTAQGMVFSTDHGGETTLWTLADYDPANYRYRYLRVTPGSRCVQVAVVCQPLDAANTRVQVSYTLTGLSAAGNAAIREFAAGYDAMLAEWRSLILAWHDKADQAAANGWPPASGA
ncbi:SRPBCC family protein [Vogesella oryzae]|uniref:SRPBCC family protein n=1 Tax=Vogesella oryzae TaxID=1735285 RepID=UPI001582F0A3|nr:SRPBCC family protein [Vogesella oryzae]